MKHYDYDWDLYPDYLKLDNELPIDKLGWQEGDIFRFETHNGTRVFKKLDPIEKFTKGYE